MLPYIHVHLRQPGDKNGDPPVGNRPERCGNPRPTGRSLIGCGSFIEPVHPWKEKFPSADQKSFHMYTTPTTRGRKCTPPRSIPPRTVWKPQPHWHLADWLGLMEPARRESCLSSQRRRPAAPGKDEVPSPDQKILPYLYNANKPGTKTQIPRVDTAPHGVDTPTPLAGC